jgi:hypothetical protein
MLLVCFAVSVVFGAISLWPFFSESRLVPVAIAIVASIVVAVFAAMCAGLAYRAIDADLHPLIRLLGLSLVSASVPAALLLLLVGDSILQMLQLIAPLIALLAGWSGLFLIGRRPGSPRQPLPQIPQPLPRGWDSQH